MNIEVKHTLLEDIFEIHREIPEFFLESPEINYFTERLKDKNYICLSALYNTYPAGYIVAYNKHNDDALYCWMAGVIPKFRKNRILSHLMQHLEKIAQQKGYSKISIKTRNTRREMLSFLVKNNFLFTKIEEYPEIQENRISLVKII